MMSRRQLLGSAAAVVAGARQIVGDGADSVDGSGRVVSRHRRRSLDDRNVRPSPTEHPLHVCPDPLPVVYGWAAPGYGGSHATPHSCALLRNWQRGRTGP